MAILGKAQVLLSQLLMLLLLLVLPSPLLVVRVWENGLSGVQRTCRITLLLSLRLMLQHG